MYSIQTSYLNRQLIIHTPQKAMQKYLLIRHSFCNFCVCLCLAIRHVSVCHLDCMRCFSRTSARLIIWITGDCNHPYIRTDQTNTLPARSDIHSNDSRTQKYPSLAECLYKWRCVMILFMNMFAALEEVLADWCWLIHSYDEIGEQLAARSEFVGRCSFNALCAHTGMYCKAVQSMRVKVEFCHYSNTHAHSFIDSFCGSVQLS